MTRIYFITAGLWLLIPALSAQSLIQKAPPEAVRRLSSRTQDKRERQSGAKLFARECAACHGAEGAGGLGKAPPLRQNEVREAAPGTLFWILRNGSLRCGMPSFAQLPEPQRWQIIAYLKQL